MQREFRLEAAAAVSNELRDHKKSFKIAEQYANGGLHLLEGEVTGNADSETTANELVAEMNDMWDEWFGGDER